MFIRFGRGAAVLPLSRLRPEPEGRVNKSVDHLIQYCQGVTETRLVVTLFGSCGGRSIEHSPIAHIFYATSISHLDSRQTVWLPHGFY